MAVYVVHLQDGVAELTAGIEKAIPEADRYKLDDNIYLVRSPGVARIVADAIGLDGESAEVGGEVFKLNGSFSGFSEPGVWDWLDQAYEKSDS